ncbi:unnamed protein product [Clonostachys byssicola]|uniref:Zn(2)-C6 fungal-type domain-containing protein n=1 Tax=Clonostachys byssicola TaxID=160290 RepID=A0A9N9Y0B5_9HYPO|nr:unnamed protein product [Clonostachys byssicola]
MTPSPKTGHGAGEPGGQQDQAKTAPRQIRRRAPRACMNCRARKVRCDVSFRDRSCTNCVLDGTQCVVNERGDRVTRYSLTDCGSSRYRISSLTKAKRPGILEDQHGLFDVDRNKSTGNDGKGDGFHQTSQDDQRSQDDQSSQEDSLSMVDETRPTVEELGNPNDFLSNSGLESWLDDALAVDAVETPYFSYSFLRIDPACTIQPSGYHFLEQQGCFLVPKRTLLDELVKQYFLHVHPFLPLIHEGHFWESYDGTTDGFADKPISLLLFQAMLFASCTFIPSTTVQSLGFDDIRSMRATYYRRAKLLYDFGSDTSALSNSQTALLLSFKALSARNAASPLWLSIAIEHAQMAEAPLYATLTPNDTAMQPWRNALKRTWWCCIIREHTLALLMKRPIRITSRYFDFLSSPLVVEDLADEFECSKVYNRATKERLARIVIRTTELFILLSDDLLHTFPINTNVVPGSVDIHQNATRVRECRIALDGWQQSVLPDITKTLSDIDPVLSEVNGQDVNEESTILYSHLMMMYYYTARALLCHNSLYLEVLQSDNAIDVSTRGMSIILGSRVDLQNATAKITDYHGDLIRRGLAQWLPISAVGCALLPLFLNIVDIKLFSTSADSDDVALMLRKEQLNILVKVMDIYTPRYDGVDWIKEILHHTSSITQLKELSTVSSRQVKLNWSDIFAFQPRLYLRLALSLDLSLSKGRLPKDSDFPLILREEAPFTPSSAHCPPTSFIVGFDRTAVDTPTDDEKSQNARISSLMPLEMLSVDTHILANIEEQIYMHLAGDIAKPTFYSPSSAPDEPKLPTDKAPHSGRDVWTFDDFLFGQEQPAITPAEQSLHKLADLDTPIRETVEAPLPAIL